MVVQDFLQRAATQDKQNLDGLTEREREVLTLIAEGMTNQQIAGKLYISIKTVQTHRAHIMEKLNLHDRTELVRYAIRKGLIRA
jgi:two-component system response regulator NreC